MGWLKHNWSYRLVALALSVVLYYYVQKQEDILRRTLLLPINIAAPAGLRAVRPLPGSSIRVDLEGPAEEVRAVENDELKLHLDVSNVPPGKEVQVPVTVEIPQKYREHVTVTWRPLAVTVRLISDAVRELPVLVQVERRADGWEVRDVPRAVPERVTVSGIQSAVDAVKSVVASIDLGPTARINDTVSLHALGEDGTDMTERVQISPPQVQVSAMQEHVVLQKRVPVQPRFRTPNGARVMVDVTPPRVRLVGPERLLDSVYTADTEQVDLPPGQREVTREVTVVTPDHSVEAIPPRVRVTLRLQPQGR